MSQQGRRIFIDLKGTRIGRWLVGDPIRKKIKRRTLVYWNCVCKCGQKKLIHSYTLRRGTSLSCGCERTERLRRRITTHGMSKSRIFGIWQGMVARCNNPNTRYYHRYGGRGIKVCKRWTKFENFYRDMGEPPERHSIDRIDNNGHYSKSNCRWSTHRQQSLNRSNNRFVDYKGTRLTISEWAQRIGTDYRNISYRLNAGWTTKNALYGIQKGSSRSTTLLSKDSITL